MSASRFERGESTRAVGFGAAVAPPVLAYPGGHRVPDYVDAGLLPWVRAMYRARGIVEKPAVCPPSVRALEERLGGASTLVFLLIDGMGMAQLRQHVPYGWLVEHCETTLTSVFPSTTATAITSVLTAQTPARHGMSGWFLELATLGEVVAPLPYRTRAGGLDLAEAGVKTDDLFWARSAFDGTTRRVVMFQPGYLVSSRYTRAHRGRAELRPFRDLVDLVGQVATCVACERPDFIYAYWPDFDRVAHERGAGSRRAGLELADIDRRVSAMAGRIKGAGGMLVVSADHGFIDTTAESRLDISAYPELENLLELPLAGEPRTVYCRVEESRWQEFESYLAVHLGHACTVCRSRDLLAMGWFGEQPHHPGFAGRIGTHVLLMKDNYVLTQQLRGEERFGLIGVHGGVSAEEMTIPLIAYG